MIFARGVNRYLFGDQMPPDRAQGPAVIDPAIAPALALAAVFALAYALDCLRR